MNDKNIDLEVKPKIKKRKTDTYQTKKCKVISYSKNLKTLRLYYDNYGIEVRNIEEYDGSEYITVKYKGILGTSDFECWV